MKQTKPALIACEIVGIREMWRMKTLKGKLYAVRELVQGVVCYVFISQHDRHEMSCTCGKQESSRLCPHIKYLEATLYLKIEVEGSIMVTDPG